MLRRANRVTWTAKGITFGAGDFVRDRLS